MTEEKAIRVVSFGGKTTEWSVWEEKFLALAGRRGYKDILQGKRTVPRTHDDDGKEIVLTGDEEKAHEDNVRAYGDLALSIDTSQGAGMIAFKLIKSTKTKSYCDGNAYEAWKSLSEKYSPTTDLSLLKLVDVFNKATMRKGSDPEGFINYLEELQVKINEIKPNKIEDDDIIIKVLNSGSNEYENVLLKLEDDFQNKKLTVKKLKEELRVKFQRIRSQFGRGGDKQERQDEKALYVYSKQFKGKCYSCGKMGHKGSECPDKKKNDENKNKTHRNNDKKRIECWYCGKRGHTRSECRKKKEDEKRNEDNEQDERGELAMTSFDEGFFRQVRQVDMSKFYVKDAGVLVTPSENEIERKNGVCTTPSEKCSEKVGVPTAPIKEEFQEVGVPTTSSEENFKK